MLLQAMLGGMGLKFGGEEGWCNDEQSPVRRQIVSLLVFMQER